MCSDFSAQHSRVEGLGACSQRKIYESASEAIRHQLHGLLSVTQAVHHMVAGFMRHYCMAGQELITSLTA